MEGLLGTGFPYGSTVNFLLPSRSRTRVQLSSTSYCHIGWCFYFNACETKTGYETD